MRNLIQTTISQEQNIGNYKVITINTNIHKNVENSTVNKINEKHLYRLVEKQKFTKCSKIINSALYLSNSF